jgi:hypothetical protein
MGFGSQVSEDNLDGLQPQQAGLLRLSLNILEPCCDFRVLMDCIPWNITQNSTTARRLHST